MREQRRTIKTPCCNTRMTIKFPYGQPISGYTCPNCNAMFQVEFKLGVGRSGKTFAHKLIRKEVL